MYSSRLGHMRYDTDAWLIDEPADWNLWRRMRDMGAAMTHLAEPVAVHFKERSSIDHRPDATDAPLAVRADDVLTNLGAPATGRGSPPEPTGLRRRRRPGDAARPRRRRGAGRRGRRVPRGG